jgi:hypothetical protein
MLEWESKTVTMDDLKQIAVGVIVTILVIMAFVATNAELWYGYDIPKRFSIRSLLIVSTAIALALGLYVAFAPR